MRMHKRAQKQRHLLVKSKRKMTTRRHTNEGSERSAAPDASPKSSSEVASPSKNGDFAAGDRVVYHPVGGAAQTSTGVIRKVLTETAAAGESGVHAKASPAHPRFVIENDHTHKETAYKRENIVSLV